MYFIFSILEIVIIHIIPNFEMLIHRNGGYIYFETGKVIIHHYSTAEPSYGAG